MLGQLVAAQFDLESAIAELARNHIPTDAARTQLEALGDLQRQIAGAGPAALTSLRGEIAVAATASRALAQQGHASSLAERMEAGLVATSARTRATVQRLAGDLFERRIFDPYLQFASPEEEDAYRRREGERQEYIRRELAKGTPQGNLNAVNATVAQIEDAGVHGADRHPQYGAMLNDARRARDELYAATEPERASDRTASQARQPPSPKTDLDEIAAALRAAGVVPPSDNMPTPQGHGLAQTAMDHTRSSPSRQS